jgi:hypothetical protein
MWEINTKVIIDHKQIFLKVTIKFPQVNMYKRVNLKKISNFD